MSDSNLDLTICRLVAYLVANVVKDEKEYRDWGLPFISISVEAQFGNGQCAIILEELNSKFCPIIGHGLSLILEDEDFEDYTLVHSAEVLLSSILNEIESNDVNFDSSLRVYMDKFFQFILSSRNDDVYDARTRVIARRMCDALNITAAEFGELESSHWQADDIEQLPTASEFGGGDHNGIQDCTSKSLARRKFYEKFNRDSKNVHPSTILASFRIWRVAFIAAGGGALMALTGALAAPAIMSTVVPLIYASTTLGQLSVTLSTSLSLFGITSLDLIPGIMSSYGAAVAGQKMLNRTAPLKDFALRPLHLHDGEQFTPSDQEGHFPALSEASAVQGKPHAPVFILVSGHLERGIDARQMWGANGFLQNIVGTATSTLTDLVDPMHVRSSTTREVDSGKIQLVRGADGVVAVPAASKSNPDREYLESPTDNYKHYACELTHTTNTADSSNGSESIEKSTRMPDDNELLTDWEEVNNVNGWWRDRISHGEEYVLQWEPSVLERLHESLQRILLDKVYGKLKGMVKGEILKFTPIPGLRAAASLPLMVMSKINELDDPWVIATDRAQQAGKLLARVLLAEHRRSQTREKGGSSVSDSAQGAAGGPTPALSSSSSSSSSSTSRITGRPISLVGYGMGARLIFHCLETLAAEGGVDARGIVENAVLIGAPVGMDITKWTAVRSVVAGRLVNCYAWNDWMLALLYRSKSYEIGVAGLYPVHLRPGASVSSTVSTVSTVSAPGSNSVAVAGSVERCEDSDQSAGTERTGEVTATHHVESVNISSDSTKPSATIVSTATTTTKVRVLNKHFSAHDVENFDVSHLISSHTDYPRVLPAIIALLDL